MPPVDVADEEISNLTASLAAAAVEPREGGGEMHAGANGAEASSGITFLISTSETDRQPPRIRKITDLSGGVIAVTKELCKTLQLPPTATFVYLSPEFDEWVAMEDVHSLPPKCRVRPVVNKATGAEGVTSDA